MRGRKLLVWEWGVMGTNVARVGAGRSNVGMGREETFVCMVGMEIKICPCVTLCYTIFLNFLLYYFKQLMQDSDEDEPVQPVKQPTTKKRGSSSYKQAKLPKE